MKSASHDKIILLENIDFENYKYHPFRVLIKIASFIFYNNLTPIGVLERKN
jgi:hypothetical protein